MAKRQHFKGKKRMKSWHRGHGEARRSEAAQRSLPDVGSGADPTAGAPVGLNRRNIRTGGSKNRARGDSL
jgi:hypothetical protein